MKTLSALLAICAGNSPVPGEFPAQRPVTRSFDVFFDLSLNKRLSKQSWGWWFETPSHPSQWHRNVKIHCGPPSDATWRHRTGATLGQVMLVAWRHQAITWTNVDWSSMRSSDNHRRAISHEITQPSWIITAISLKTTFLKFQSNIPGEN